jgi:hypothetical protein
MGNLEWRGFFANSAAPRAQFHILSLFVWVSASILIILSRNYWHNGKAFDPRVALPVVQLMPWFIAVLERRRLSKLASREGFSSEFGQLRDVTILRLLWAGYLALAIAECILY